MFKDNIRLRCAIMEEALPGKKGSFTVYGYEIGAVCQKSWHRLVASPVIYGSMAEAQELGDAALLQAQKALTKRYLKNQAMAAKIASWQGEGDAS